MLGALVMPMNVQEVSAASSTYMSVIPQYNDMPREKTGGYYIWVEDQYNQTTGASVYYLKCSKSTKKKAKVLITIKSDSFFMNAEVVSNGKYVFYSVSKGGKSSIYRVAIKGGKPKLMKDVKGSVKLGTYYKGRLYYEQNTTTTKLVSLNVSNKTTRTEKKKFHMDSGYGAYLTGIDLSTTKRKDRGPKMILVYNAGTRKTVKTQVGMNSVAAGKWVYIYNYDFSDINKPTLIVKRCTPSGKQVKTIKRYKGKEWASYFGRTNLYLENNRGKVVKKLNYSTGKITKAR